MVTDVAAFPTSTHVAVLSNIEVKNIVSGPRCLQAVLRKLYLISTIVELNHN